MKEEKVGQNEELEFIDFDLEFNDEQTKEPVTPVQPVAPVMTENVVNEPVTPVTPVMTQNVVSEPVASTPVTPVQPVKTVEPVQNVEVKEPTMSKTEKIVDSMQNFVEKFTEPAPVEKTSTFGEIFKKVENVKKPIEKIKVLLSEKRSRAVGVLLLWIVFMIFAVAVIKGNITVTPDDDGDKTVDTAISTLSKINNYGYSIVLVTPKEGSKTIAGNYYENRALFTFNGERYYTENNVYSKVENNALKSTNFNLEIDLNNLSPFAIANILEKSKVLANTTDGNGLVTARSYGIKASELMSYLYNVNVDSDVEIKIDVRYEDNAISSLEINMFDIVDLQPDGKKVEVIHVEYRFVGKITANDVAYDMTQINMGPDEYFTSDEAENEPEGEE